MELMITENYHIRVNCNGSNELLLELSDVFSGDSWKGVFDANYIEDLTRKTGNFKSFSIFVNMLRTALSGTSKTVTLEILTYSDLEALRMKKSAHNQNISSNSNIINNANNHNKRYLILTYNVEFDSINYPLQLNYQGRVDSHVLINTIKSLKNQLKSYESQLGLKRPDTSDMISSTTLMDEEVHLISKLNSNKQAITTTNTKNPSTLMTHEALSQHHQHVNDASTSNHSHNQQIRLLKQIVKTIEEKSLKEKTVLQKQLAKKRQECESLKQQLSEMRINERGLRTELRQLSNEVRILKQHNRPIRQSPSILPKRSSSVESLTRFGYLQDTCSSSRSRRSSYNQIAGGGSRASSRSSSVNSRRNVSPIGPSRPSPASNRKFNPTEYVNSRRMKLEENECRKKREFRGRLNCSGGSGINGSRQSLHGSNLSLADSESGFSYLSMESSQVRSVSGQRGVAAKSGKQQHQQQQQQRPRDNSTMDELYQTSDEMREIDEKLKSLQMLIQNAAD